MNDFHRLIREAHRRSLWQVLLIYLGASWAVLEASDHVVERFAMPDWVYGGVVLLLLVGLPVVLATAFVQEGADSPAPAVEETSEASASPTAGAFGLLTWRNAISGGVLAFALWGIVAAVWLAARQGPDTVATEEAQPSVAVLPFTTTAMQADDADFFAGGLHDELLTQLAKISGLSVISRTSVMRYAGTRRTIPEVARELGVATVVEGSVQRTADRLRVNVQLVDGLTDEHLWAETYDRSLTLSNIFDIQGEIAQRIASELRVELTPAELAELDRRTTDNLDAYELFLRGRNHYARRFQAAEALRALELFREAREVDSEFAAAHAAEAMARIWQYWYRGAFAQRDSARDALGRAAALDPDGVETRLAQGLYRYRVQGDYVGALESLQAVRARAPGDASVIGAVGAVQRRLGMWEEAAGAFARTTELNPGDISEVLTVVQTYRLMRRPDAALRYVDRAISHDPTSARARGEKSWTLIGLEEDTAAARRALEDLEGEDLVAARAWGIQHSPPADPAYYRRDWDSVLELQRRTGGLSLALALWLAGDRQAAAALGDSIARLRVEDDGVERSRLGEAGWYAFTGLALALAGDSSRAVEYADRSTELVTPEYDAFYGTRLQSTRMIASIVLGDQEDALDRLEFLVSVPSEAQHGFLRLDPVFDALRDNPRFEQIVSRAEAAVRRESPGAR